MSWPVINVTIWRAGANPGDPRRFTSDVSNLVSQEHSPEISARIEKPGETNSFTAADVSMTFRDDGTVKNLLLPILPDSTDYRVDITVDGGLVFSGNILPNTVVIDEVQSTVSLTAAQDGILLSQVGAQAQFSRTYSGSWRVLTSSVADLSCLTIRDTSGAAIGDQFMSGDPVEWYPPRGATPLDLGTIASIAVLGSPSPSNTYQLWLDKPMASYPPVGSRVDVPQASFWKRGLSIQQAVEYCYQAAGLVPPTTDSPGVPTNRFYVGPIATPTPSTFPDMVAVPLTTLGLNGAPLGVISGRGSATPRQFITAGTTNGAYDLFTPPAVGYGGTWTSPLPPNPDGAGWAPPAGSAVQPIGSSMWGGREYVLCGPRFFASQGASGQVTIYSYDYSKPTLGGNARFGLTYQYGFTGDPRGPRKFYVTWHLTVETTNDGYTWGNGRTLASSDVLYCSQQVAREIYDNPLGSFQNATGEATGMWGIGVFGSWDYATNPRPFIVFTELTVDDTGDRSWQLSQYRDAIPPGNPGVITKLTDVIHGWCEWGGNGSIPYIYVYQPDDALTKLTAYCWKYDPSSQTFLNQGGFDAPMDLKPWTVRYWNTIDPETGRYCMYGLSASKAGGVKLHYFVEPFSTPQNSVVLAAPGKDREWVDVATITDFNRQTNYPLAALFDGVLWWIDTQPAQSVPFVDASNSTAGDILAGIAAAYGCVYYQDPQGNNYFRSRSLASAVAVNAAVPGLNDDPRDIGLISFRSQPIWSQNYRLVTVTNSSYRSIVAALTGPGATAGIAASGAALLAGNIVSEQEAITAFYPPDQSVLSGSSYELQVDNAFIASFSHAYALAEALYAYFSNPMPTIELERELDQRDWSVGRTFHTTVLGTRAQYIIIDSSRQILASTVRFQALRMN